MFRTGEKQFFSLVIAVKHRMQSGNKVSCCLHSRQQNDRYGKVAMNMK